MTDLIITENWPRCYGGIRHPRTCRCSRCSSVGGLAGEAIFEAALESNGVSTPPGKVPLPHQFSGWSRPVSVLDRRRRSRSAAYPKVTFPINRSRPLDAKSYVLYRITVSDASVLTGLPAQFGRPRQPLYIGKTWDSGGYWNRILKHFVELPDEAETAKLQELFKYLKGVKGLKSRLVMFQLAIIVSDDGQRQMKSKKLLLAYEAALQHRERPYAYI